MECFGEHLDELSEIHALVGDIIEYRLVAVALVFHVANLHLQSEILGYLSALYHRVVFPALGLAKLVHVGGTCNAVDASDVVGRLEVGLLDL